MFNKDHYWKNKNKKKEPIEKKLYKPSNVQIQFIDGKMVAMPRYIRRNKKGNT